MELSSHCIPRRAGVDRKKLEENTLKCREPAVATSDIECMNAGKRLTSQQYLRRGCTGGGRPLLAWRHSGTRPRLSGWLIAWVLLWGVGCQLGPRTIHSGRIRYNEAVKQSSEQQLLLNIVRLRYTDAPSSLALSSIADQRELAGNLGLTPFFTSAGAGDVGTYRATALPGLQVSGATRPTLSYTPMDDQEFTRRLFTPISTEGIAYLIRTTWPISSVFRLYLENLNWVSNAETASGPTPCLPPEYADFLAGIHALQRLQDRQLIAIHHEVIEEVIAVGEHPSELDADAAVNATREGYKVRWSQNGPWAIVHEVRKPILRLGDVAPDDEDLLVFCHAFRLNPNLRRFPLTSEEVDPFYEGIPLSGLDKMDLETRSLLQVLFFVSHGVDVPEPHITAGIASSTIGDRANGFDWSQVMNGLMKIQHCKSKHPPTCALVAVRYRDYWFYIDQRDRNSKSTFLLLLEVSRLELNTPSNAAPLLTLPLGR